MKKKVLVITFRHETNSFCPVPADETAYRNFLYGTGIEIVKKQKGVKNEIGAFLDVLDGRDDIELIPSVTFQASPCGPVSKHVYDTAVKEVCRVIEETGSLDGVIINFHGAMVSDEHSDGEGDFLEIIRSYIGDEIPVICSLDLHANVTAKMAKHATALVPYFTYPHIDIYETGLLTAQLMSDTLDGSLKPEMSYIRIPFLLPLFSTDSEEMKPLYELCSKLESNDGVRTVRFAHGFFPADIEEMGMSVMVVTNGDKELADRVAQDLAYAINKAIPTFKPDYLSLDEVLDRALKADSPIAIGDASDNPGAGGVGDSTHILRRALERGIKGMAIATIYDPQSVEKCIKSGVGTEIELELGGKESDEFYSGGPLQVKGYIKAITDGKYVCKDKMCQGETLNHGTTAILNIDGNVVIVSSVRRQPFDLEVFRSNGITPEDMKILVSKSSIHYKASYGTVCKEMYTVALRGYASPVPDGFVYKNWKNK